MSIPSAGAQAMKCAICKQSIMEGKPFTRASRTSSAGKMVHTMENVNCTARREARAEERVDILAWLKTWEYEIPLGIFVSIERGEHVGAAKRGKP